jgi:hypothetical protein
MIFAPSRAALPMASRAAARFAILSEPERSCISARRGVPDGGGANEAIRKRCNNKDERVLSKISETILSKPSAAGSATGAAQASLVGAGSRRDDDRFYSRSIPNHSKVMQRALNSGYLRQLGGSCNATARSGVRRSLHMSSSVRGGDGHHDHTLEPPLYRLPLPSGPVSFGTRSLCKMPVHRA